MIICDAHCDTLSVIMKRNCRLFRNNCHIDIERMLRKNDHIQFFAAFTNPSYGPAYSLNTILKMFDYFLIETANNSEYISLCISCSEIENSLKQGKIAALLSIEGGEILQGELSTLRMFYRLGVRSICLTWNNRNEIADGADEEASGGGLTRFGEDVVREMNSIGMIIDLSHISSKGFFDVINISKKPVIVSHSNAMKICSHRRNLNDEQIYAIKKNGGVIGINLYPYFLNNTKNASVTDVLKHIEHIAGIAGDDHIGIGSDFDGIDCIPQGINGVEDLDIIFNELLKLNYKQESVEKIAGLNFIRVIKNVLK